MKKICSFCITIILSFSVTAEELVSIDWQASKSSIKANATAVLTEDSKNRLTFEQQLFELPFHLEYVFTEQGQLKNVLYYHSVKPEDSNCAEKYEQLKSKLTKQFGSAETQISSANETIVAEPEKLCGFTASGEYSMNSIWTKEKQVISFMLSTWKGTPYIGLMFHPVN